MLLAIGEENVNVAAVTPPETPVGENELPPPCGMSVRSVASSELGRSLKVMTTCGVAEIMAPVAVGGVVSMTMFLLAPSEPAAPGAGSAKAALCNAASL